jgi:hypothetical protein
VIEEADGAGPALVPAAGAKGYDKSIATLTTRALDLHAEKLPIELGDHVDIGAVANRNPNLSSDRRKPGHGLQQLAHVPLLAWMKSLWHVQIEHTFAVGRNARLLTACLLRRSLQDHSDQEVDDTDRYGEQRPGDAENDRQHDPDQDRCQSRQGQDPWQPPTHPAQYSRIPTTRGRPLRPPAWK